MTTLREQPDYLAYQLRLWCVRSREGIAWRVSLKSARTRKERRFANLDDLCDFLKQQTGAVAGSDGK